MRRHRLWAVVVLGLRLNRLQLGNRTVCATGSRVLNLSQSGFCGTEAFIQGTLTPAFRR